MKFSYDGSCFNGYQRQPNKKTIQGEIEKLLYEIEKKEVTIHASGRTDKGVHAKIQYAHFDLTKTIKPYNLKKYLNNHLSGEIYIDSINEVKDDFHARYNVKSKTYSYYINMGTYSPIERNYMYQYNKDLDIKSIKKATKYLIGKHDFRSFCTGEKEKENCVRQIYKINVKVYNNILKITFTGNGFLRKMIRNMVATLIKIGTKEKKPNYIKEVLDNKKRLGNMKSTPGTGLYLEEINY